MEWQEIEVDGLHTVKFTDLPYVPLANPSQSPVPGDLSIDKKLGGILRHGEWGWLARYSAIQIVSLRSGQTISSYEFSECRGYENCCIKCVEEIFPNNPEIMLLAVVLESFHGPGGGCSYVAVYSVELNKVLHNIELSLQLTCARFMEASACRRSLLQNFNGCLAVGSVEGVIVLLDLNVRKLTSLQNQLDEDIFVPCHIVDCCLPLTEIHRHFRQCQQDGIHFGLQMEVIENPSAIQCILPIDLILGLAIGLKDGRLVLYDLTELQIFYVGLPNPEVALSSLVKMDFLEPSDDPRPCLFIWALHENGKNLHAVLHSLMYEKRLVDEEHSVTYFETFQACSVRLQLPLEATNSTALACQAISSVSTYGEDDANCLCAISWLSVLEGKNKLLIFDLNQWYKEEMPFLLEYGKQPNYLAGYILSGECCGLQTLLNPNNIAHFNSMQRFEEHFYPNSLSFESLLLNTEGCRRYNWEGAQNRVVNLLRSSNAAIFLEPNFYFNEVMRTRLMPQFMELNMNSTFSRNAKCEILLSAALEHNCVSLLRDCAKSWIDGSFMGNFAATTGLSLSTLTDWIWKRATCIKSRCNDLCKSLFEFGGYPLDSREQKELGFITRQLKLLAELLKEILVYAKKQIPERVFSDLSNKQSSLSMASNYQDILLWLLNIGLLPEASPHNDKINTNSDLIPYPYQDLKEFYKTKRSFYSKLNESFISKKSGSCRLLFIDSLIEHVCTGNILREYWLENEGNGLYPPNSLEAMLRVMLVPDLDYDNKCAILLYFFLDLNMAIEEEDYKDVVANFIKFPSVFKLSASLIKTVQAFWNLDHDQYLPAVDEFISPFNKNQSYPQWQVELLIEVLLNQKAANLALRILESQPSLISPLLKLNTLLANDLISEAFHFVRSKNDDSLLETFYTRCLCNGQFGVIRDLALNDHEGLILQNILKNMKTPGAESLHFVYLLQKSKYIEAVSYMEEMSNRTKGLKTSFIQNSEMDTPNLVLSAFNTTMTPVTQGLTDIYFRIKNKIKKKEMDNQSPVPLSCQLIKQNANSLLGGIYHSSALSAHFATYYWGEMEEQTAQTKHLLNSNNAPFLRRPQIDTNCRGFLNTNNISYPQVYRVNEKRTLVESGVHENDRDEYERQKLEYRLNPNKKRRLVGQEIVDDLANIIKMNKAMSGSEFNFGPKQKLKELEASRNESFDLLLLPLPAKPKETDTTKTSQTEIQGILKTYAPDSSQRDPINEEEKNLRFKLPSTETTTTQMQREEVRLNDKVTQNTMDNVEEQKSPEDSPNYKRFSRSISAESNRSSDSKSVENFYSPLSSQNNSKLDSSNISRQSILSGPQPRKPLARLSAEHSHKSITPERGTQTTETTQYVTAVVPNTKSEISLRSSLERCNTEEDIGRESTTLAFVTAKETSFESFELSSESKIKQTDNGFGGLSSAQATFTVGKIDDFLPKVSSSKVGATEPVKIPEPAKISECSTVLGSFTTLESLSSIDTYSNINSVTNPSDEQKRHMLETTLSMSTYDVSILETKALQQAKSPSMVTEKETTLKIEVTKEIETKLNEPTENKTREVRDKSPVVLSKESSLLASKDVCIVLTSSSSNSSSSSTFEQQQNDDCNENYNDYDNDEEKEYEVDTVDYERGEEYEIDDEDYDRGDEYEIDNNVNMEDDVEDYKDSEVGDQPDIDTLEEGVDDDYTADLSTEESDNSIVDKNVEVIQLVEDSSSDVQQQYDDHYDDSESDDVKVIEDDISTDGIEEKTPVKESKFQENENENMDKNTSNSAKLLSLPGKKVGNSYSNMAEKRKEISVIGNYSMGIDIRINETDSEELKQKDVKHPSSYIEEKQKQTVSESIDMGKKTEDFTPTDMPPVKGIQEEKRKTNQENSGSHSEPLSVEYNRIEKRTSEEIKVQILNSQKITESIVNIEAKEQSEKPLETKSPIKEKTREKSDNNESLEEQSMSLRMEESSDGSPAKEKPVENIEKQPETISEKTDNNESVGKQSMPLRMEVSNKESLFKKTSEENVAPVSDNTENVTLALRMQKLNDESQQTNKKTKDLIEKRAQSVNEDTSETSSEAIVNKNLLKAQETEQDFAEQPSTSECIGFKVSEKSELAAENKKEIGPDTLKSTSKFLKELDVDLTPRRTTRSTSVPPQTIVETEESVNVTPSKRRSMRAASLQLKPRLEDHETSTPSRTQKGEEPEGSEKRITRGSSVPPGAVEGKMTRRRSVLLDAINEDASVLDSPSTRTRLRSRLNSRDSELDSPLTQQRPSHKRTRRDSTTSQSETIALVGTPRSLKARSVQSVQEENSQTPKRKRHDSATSHPDTNISTTTPRSLRSRSVLTVQEEDAESMPASPKTTSKKTELKHLETSDEPLREGKDTKEQSSPKSDTALVSEATYSSSRRLTRTQLAIMEKSAFLMQAATVSPPQNKRPNSRAKRTAALNADSDDGESVSSKLSTVSSVTGTKRRVTRSSVKEKDDVEDDGVSVASSFGSEKQLRTRRSKDKSSPNTTLTTIPEDAPIEPKKRGRPAKH